MVLNEIIELLKSVAQNNEAYEYGNAMADHILVVSRDTLTQLFNVS